MSYTSGCHTVFHHRYHIVWVPKYRYKVLEGDIRLHVRETYAVRCVSKLSVECCPRIMCICLLRYHPIYQCRSLYKEQRGVQAGKCSKRSRDFVASIGGVVFGPEDTSVQQVAISQMRSSKIT